MSTPEPKNKKEICDLWGVSTSVKEVQSILHQAVHEYEQTNQHFQSTNKHKSNPNNRTRKRKLIDDADRYDDDAEQPKKRRKVVHRMKMLSLSLSDDSDKENAIPTSDDDDDSLEFLPNDSNTEADDCNHNNQTKSRQRSVSPDDSTDSSESDSPKRPNVFALWRYKNAAKSLSATSNNKEEADTTAQKRQRKQKQIFKGLKIKYSISANKSYVPSYMHMGYIPKKKQSNNPINDISDLYKLLSEEWLGECTFDEVIFQCEYDSIIQCDYDAMECKTLYDKAINELRFKPSKPKRKQGDPPNNSRQDYTVQARIKKTKELSTASGTRRYCANIEISLNRFQKTGDCFVVDIPYTLALTATSQALTNSVMEDLMIAEHEIKTPLIDNAVRYHDDDSASDEEEEDKELMCERQKRFGLNVIAFPYQVQSIEWMIGRETDEEGLYKYLFAKGAFKSGDVFYYSAVLNRLVIADQLPVLRGGFLCEEMGLGKTIECLAVIHCNRRQDEYSTAMRNVLAFKQTALRKKRVEVKQPHEVKKKVYKLVQQMEEYTYYKGKGTLIIAPVSLIGQWEQELDTRSNGNLTYTRYYGARSRDMSHYFDFDVIFTTFGVLAKEDGHDRKTHVLHRIQWHRIIIDESHCIKNGAARTSINSNELKANNKWCLSGTPFERPMDLLNQLKFVGIKQEYLNAMGLNRTERYSPALIKVIQCLCMRHIKSQQFNGKAITTMPEKEEDVIYVQFDAKQKEYYDKLYAIAKQTYDSYAATGNISRGFIPILSSLHPARQACSGYIASMNAIEKQLSEAQQNSHKIRAMVQRNKNKSANELYELARVEAYNKDGQCVICLECPPDEPLQTVCRHIFCGECIRVQLEVNGVCPICRNKTDVHHLQLPPSEKKEKEENTQQDVIKFDAKLNVLIQKIKALKHQKADDKSLIFTSFSKSLNWICSELQRNDIKYSTLTGSMTMNKRKAQLAQFAHNADVKVFVLTVRTGAVGLTLNSANHVFMMEPTWNPALHRQAINRVYRLGQQKKVFIHTLIMKRSIEERIWKINEEKQTGRNMYGNIKDDKAAALPATDIDKLFTI
eukprot:858119_1